MKVILSPINSRFKRLINNFGKNWVATCDPTSMHCFGGMLGITAMPSDGTEKWSNFKISEVELIP